MTKSLYAIAFVVVIAFLSGCTTVEKIPVPPSPQDEVMGAAPYTGAVWIKGHWVWRKAMGTYVWVPGHWRAAY